MTSSLEILGNPTCVYKARFRYDPCRSCNNGYNPHCENYTPRYNHSRKSSGVEKSVEIQTYEPTNEVVVRSTRISPTVPIIDTHSDSYNHSPQTKPLGSKPLSFEDVSRLGDKPADFMLLRTPRQSRIIPKTLEAIRRATDGGCI